MKDSRNPTHVYLDIIQAKTFWNEGILAAADRVEHERRAGAQAAPSLAPRDYADAGPSVGEAPQNGAQGVPEQSDTNGDLAWKP